MAGKLPTITANPNWNAAQMKAFEQLDAALPVAMAYLLDEIPVIDNHTNAMLVDEVGDLKKAKKLFDGAEKAHVGRLKIRMNNVRRENSSGEVVVGVDDLKGDIYEARYRGSVRTILNQEKCKELLTAFDNADVSIERLLAAIQSGQLQVPENVMLAPERAKTPEEGEGMHPPESNVRIFHTTADGGRALYVEAIV